MKRENLDPAPGFLLVERDELPGTVGKIHLPEQNALRAQSGVVVVPSVDAADDYPEGCRVVFGEYAGETLKIDGDVLTILNLGEILCTIVEEEKPA